MCQRPALCIRSGTRRLGGDGDVIEGEILQRSFPRGAYVESLTRARRGNVPDAHIPEVRQPGATLLGSQRLADYPRIPTRVAGIEMSWLAALVNVCKQHDVRIEGAGTIDGDGKVFWESFWKIKAEYQPKGLRWAADYDAPRPRLIQIYKSSHVTLAGPLLTRSGFWTVHICYSDHVHVDGVTSG